MVQSPSWATNMFAASQEIPRISRNQKVHYRTHKLPPPVSIMGQPNPVHIPTAHLLEIHPNIIHPPTSRSPQWFFPSGFPTKTRYTHLSSPIRTTCTAHLILLDFITRTMLGEEYKSFSSSLCNLLHSSVTSSLLGPKFSPQYHVLKHPQLPFLPQLSTYYQLINLPSRYHKLRTVSSRPFLTVLRTSSGVHPISACSLSKIMNMKTLTFVNLCINLRLRGTDWLKWLILILFNIKWNSRLLTGNFVCWWLEVKLGKNIAVSHLRQTFCCAFC